MTKLKILQISCGSERIPPVKGGAIGLDIFNASKHMAKKHEVTIVDRKYSESDLDNENVKNITITRLPTKILSLSFLETLYLSRFIYMIQFILNEANFAVMVNRYINRKSDFDIIFVHTPITGFLVAIFNKKLRQKMIYISHTNLWATDSKSLTFYYKIFSKVESYLMRNVRNVVALNEIFRRKFIAEANVKEESVAVISNGVDLEIFRPNIDTQDIKERYKTFGKFTVLFVGRISKVKGIDYLIQAFDIIVNRLGYKNVVLLLVGPFLAYGINTPKNSGAFEEFNTIQDMIKKFKLQEYIQFVGPVDHFNELGKFYAVCDVFVLPSLEESFGLVVTEAMACGKPVIGTNIPGVSSQIIDGHNGFLVEKANENKLADKIKFFIDNPDMVKSMGIKSRIIAEEKFGWEKISEKLLRNYEQT